MKGLLAQMSLVAAGHIAIEAVATPVMLKGRPTWTISTLSSRCFLFSGFDQEREARDRQRMRPVVRLRMSGPWVVADHSDSSGAAVAPAAADLGLAGEAIPAAACRGSVQTMLAAAKKRYGVWSGPPTGAGAGAVLMVHLGGIV